MEGWRPTGEVVAVVAPSPRRRSVVGVLRMFGRHLPLLPKDSRLPRATAKPSAVPPALREALHRAWGSAGRVIKRRWLLMARATRIHLDEVEGLGHFLELEVVLRDDQTEAEGQAIARDLIAKAQMVRLQRGRR